MDGNRMTESASRTIAAVTGAAKGIGLEVARQLAQKGITVLLTARNLAGAQQSAQALAAEGLDVRAYQLDVTHDDSVRQFAAQIERDFGKLDILINNAAAFADWMEKVTNADLNNVKAVFDTNLFGPWRMIQVLLPLLRNSEHARIVNVSSGAGSFGDPVFGLTSQQGAVASYGISKTALTALTVKLSAELAGSGILVNAVDPGLTATAPGMEAMGAQPIAEGAAGVVWAALLGDDGPTGGFFRHGQPMPW